MYYAHNLRSNVQEWRNRMYKANYDTITNEFNFLFERISNNSTIQGIIQRCIDLYPWAPDKRDEIYEQIMRDNSWFSFDNEEEQTAWLYQLLQKFKSTNDKFTNFCMNVGNGRQFDEYRDSFMEKVIEPLLNYVHDQLDEGNFTLYLLEKYKRRVEWFTHRHLSKLYDERNGIKEDVFEDDLRLFLFDQGIDYPFSTPKTSAGRSDIVGNIHTNDPLILEIKIYDTSKNYGLDRIKSGFNQITKYTASYNKQVGYLAIFNLDNVELDIESEDITKHFPSRISVNNRQYYIIVINLNFEVAPSKQGQLKTVRITKEQLIEQIEWS